jgi:hypothetical protein
VQPQAGEPLALVLRQKSSSSRSAEKHIKEKLSGFVQGQLTIIMNS